jgi:hypothetical protein
MLALPRTRAGRVRRRAQHLLPPGDDRRPGRPGLPGRLAGRTPVAWWPRLADGVLAAGRAVCAGRAPITCGPAAPARRTGPVPRAPQHFWADFRAVFAAFFAKPDILRILAFLLLYRFAEAQLLKLVTPFLLDPREHRRPGPEDAGGGHCLRHGGRDRADAGRAAGRLGDLARRPEAPAVAADVCACTCPTRCSWRWRLAAQHLALISAGARAGAVRLRLRLHRLHGVHADGGRRRGRAVHKTAHYALCTGFMALGMMLPGMWAGWLQDQIGYLNFFIWACVATLPSFAARGRSSPRTRAPPGPPGCAPTQRRCRRP